MEYGLEPQVGALVQEAYEDDAESVDHELEPLAFAGDKEALKHGVYSAMLRAIEVAGHPITDRELAIRNWGAIVVIKAGDDYFDHKHENEDDGTHMPIDHPMQVEPGDYYSREGVEPDYVISGAALIRFLKSQGVVMERYSSDIPKERQDRLVGWARRVHPEIPVPKIIERVQGLSRDEFLQSEKYYQNALKGKAASEAIITEEVPHDRTRREAQDSSTGGSPSQGYDSQRVHRSSGIYGSHRSVGSRTHIGSSQGSAPVTLPALEVNGKTASTLTLWHGGRLDDAYDESMSHSKGRWEYGPGLYLTTHYSTAQKYAKGGRKFYRVTISSGNDARVTDVPLQDAKTFVESHVTRSKMVDTIQAMDRNSERGLKADVFINILLNRGSLPATRSGKLREFLVQHGVDYEIVDNAFGWGERMIVLFNMAKIIKKEVVAPKEKLEVFDLPTEFQEEKKARLFRRADAPPVTDLQKSPAQLAQDAAQAHPLPAPQRVDPTQTPEFKAWFGKSVVVNRDGTPKKVMHGSTHAFEVFDPSKGDEEGFYGKGIYFTDSKVDVNSNYGTAEGPDLNGRIDRRAEQLMDEMDGTEAPDWRDAAYAQARKEIMGQTQGLVYVTYLRILKPVVVTPNGGTRFEGGRWDPKNEDNYIESRQHIKLYDCTLRSCYELGCDGGRIWQDVNEGLETYDGYTAYQFEEVIREGDEAMNVQGGPGPLIARIWQFMGFDGIIMNAEAQFGKSMEMSPGTNHYIVWNPRQVKSAIGNSGKFNPRSPRMVARLFQR